MIKVISNRPTVHVLTAQFKRTHHAREKSEDMSSDSIFGTFDGASGASRSSETNFVLHQSSIKLATVLQYLFYAIANSNRSTTGLLFKAINLTERTLHKTFLCTSVFPGQTYLV